MIFETKGNLEEWSEERWIRPGLSSPIYRREVFLEEWNGTNNTNVNVNISINLSEKAYSTSVIAYEGNKSLETDLENKVDIDNDGLLESSEVIFKVNVSSSSSKTIFIYYTKDENVETSYATLTPSNHTLNTTVFSSEKEKGVSISKLNRFKTLSYTEVKRKLGLDKNFRLELKNASVMWSFGKSLPDGENLATYQNKLLYQSGNGRINVVKGIAYIW